MTKLSSLRLLCAAGALAFAFNASADSTSSASSAGSASSGSVSDSIGASSNSSSGGKNKVADGAYHVIDIAQAPDRKGMTRVTLQADNGSFVLTLPEKTLNQAQLAKGDAVYAKNLEFGVEFARADTREAFFLAIADEVYGELASRKVTL
ncbi:hypothetical protein GJ700_10365 [Duganella sp. FT92W]|uniref:DUF5666 domain-containing protein n=1 Tax=Pseudoduganella rivuli TaxID=2666085 RepID=A0A7X2ILA4_9BURK|nr:hypothetical protein [Pseudoduganella rivuli]MRV72117.1 hypothetical protein [Pseudoduganella rivuli]